MSNFKITKVTAFVGIDPADGDEGVFGFVGADGQWTPLICADEARIASMYPMAEYITKTTGREYRVLQFSVREDVTEEVKGKYKTL